MTKLSVNINKIATLRNARGGNTPNLLKMAEDIQRFGAEGITIHPRPDERHIRYKDAIDLGLDTLRNIVFHEIAHAVYGTEHDESCPLMQSALNTILNKEDCLKHLLTYPQ